MYEKDLIEKLCFSLKENTTDVYYKTYTNRYTLEIDFEKKIINYGEKIKSDSKTTQNFSQPENFVVLECVDRLLRKGYKPEDITLEKVFPSGHGHSGRLDIFIKNGNKAFLMIECKTFGKEFDKEFAAIAKNGGQLFTYFQNDTNTDYLMLYTSRLFDEKVEYKSEIIKIEDSYRTAGNVEDVYNRWNKITYKNGIFESWINAYEFQNKLLTKKELQPLQEEDSGLIFNNFASILRKHSVSDKPNAFNKIFNLFLAKIYDEQKRDTDELDFQWKEKIDDPVEFQIRLINLHKAGLLEFLRKEIAGISDDDFNCAPKDLYEKKKEKLKFNKIFDIKDVIDDESFDDNFRVLKEVVQLLEKYQIRYPRRQRHLSDFFERLLTTGLKQEAGQYFTPPPITRFIVRSLPLRQKIMVFINQPEPKLPAVIDYAAGSGHFLTEILETYQDIIDGLDTSDFFPKAKQKIKTWSKDGDPYVWAAQYIYGIEKDYRLVKVAKVGCYFYGDGLAQVFHADGLDSFVNSKAYDGLLKKRELFDIVISNPPYSIDGFKGDLRNKDAKDDFTLYPYLTDKSSEIECLFVERTAQLLKEGGIAGIILPSSLLNNTSIYTKTREILLQKFEIIAITELGSNTFMATGTHTVVLFLRRKNDDKVSQIREAAYHLAETYPADKKDLTTGGIEKPVAKYFAHTGETEINAEKLFYFILAYNQTIVLIKTGEKDAEKRFLGYEFSNRRGSEGIHPIQRDKTIDECTRLYDETSTDNPQKASTYIYRAFNGDIVSEIDASLQDNVVRVQLVNMLVFDRKTFDKTISTTIENEISFESIWNTNKLVFIADIAEIKKGTSITKQQTVKGNIPVVAGGQGIAYYHNESNREGNVITISASGANSGFVNYFDKPIFASDCNTIKSKDEKNISTKLLYWFLKSIQTVIYSYRRGQAQPHVYASDIAKIKIPLPPLDIQNKIVAEIEAVEENEQELKRRIVQYQQNVNAVIKNSNFADYQALESLLVDIKGNKTKIEKKEFKISGKYPIITQEQDILISGYTNNIATITDLPLIVFGDHSCTFKYVDFEFIRGADGTQLIKTDENIILSKFLYYYLRTIKIENTEKYERHFKYLKSIRIPLPPLPEQQKIVTDIEKLEAEIQSLQKQQEQLKIKKEQILKKYL
jgi:type I restriction enzyme M protein